MTRTDRLASTEKLCRMLSDHALISNGKAKSPLKIILPLPTAFKAPPLIGQVDFWNYSLQPCATAHAAFIVGTTAFRTADTGGWKLKEYFCWWWKFCENDWELYFWYSHLSILVSVVCSNRENWNPLKRRGMTTTGPEVLWEVHQSWSRGWLWFIITIVF